MKKTRVSVLAKNFGISNKEMLEHLKEMKIHATSPSSAIEDVFIPRIKRTLQPILDERTQKQEAEKKAAEEAAAEEARKVARAKEEEARKAEEARLESKRAEEERIRIEAEKARLEQEQAEKAAAEKAALEKEAQEKAATEKAAAEKADNISSVAEKVSADQVKAVDTTRTKRERGSRRTQERSSRTPVAKQPSKYSGLLDQIARQEELLRQQKEENEARARAKSKPSRQRPSRQMTGEGPVTSSGDSDVSRTQSPLRSRNTRSRADEAPREDPQTPSRISSRPSRIQKEDNTQNSEPSRSRRKRRKDRRGESGEEDRYSRMAREAEAYNRSRVLEEARSAIEEASRESTGRRRQRKERRQKQAAEAAYEHKIEEALANDQDISQIDTVKVPQGSTVSELSELLGVNANDIIKRLFLLGTPLTLTESMSDDLIELVADDLGREVKVMTKEEENSFTFYDDPAALKPRPPVVTVMGHVDHGKTSLLDAIRHTGVAEGEAGGITQAIGASQVKIHGRPITFIDTPGHETFTAMRARGAKVTDIVVLIVAADDGVMPQTVESINHARAAEVPIIVAVNKIDKPGANPDKVRQELTEYQIVPEEWGGQNMFVDISAKKKIGIDELLETILLQADVLELKANPDAFASGNVLEAKLDKGRGPVATMLVTRGTLKVGDALVAGLAYGHVRAMLDPKGRPVAQAGPSDAVEILGLQSVPMAGDEFRVFSDDRDARNLADQRALKARIEEQNRVKHVTLENLFATMADADVKELNLIIKADVQGSIEALQDSLDKMDQSEVRINTIHSAVGAISETDVVLADASNAIIIGFGVRPEAKAKAAAERANVEIRTYSVIYKAIEDIDAARIGMLKPTEVEVTCGTAEVRDTFKVPKVGVAAGCMVQEGEISRTDKVRLIRDGVVVYEGAIASLRRFKDDVRSVKAGFECGIGLDRFQDIKPGDVIEAYRIDLLERSE